VTSTSSQIYVLPGPHDIDWSNRRDSGSGFSRFRAIFANFCKTPAFTGPNGSIGRPDISSTELFVVYPINTCFSLDVDIHKAAPNMNMRSFNTLVERYRRLWSERRRKGERYGDEEFLRDAAALIGSDTGLVWDSVRQDFEEFLKTMRDDGKGAPLRILLSHHPLASFTTEGGQMISAATGAYKLLQLAEAGQGQFHLALSGHAHVPHVLADMTFSAKDRANPLLQISGGSFIRLAAPSAPAPMFNEIIATRDVATGQWWIDLKQVQLDGNQSPANSSLFFLGSPTRSLIDNLRMSPGGEFKSIYEQFQYKLGVALRQFSDAFESHPRTEAFISDPLNTIKEIVSDVIFADIETRVGLLIKEQDNKGQDIALHYRYIREEDKRDQQSFYSFPYPDTFAAWSLIQGEEIIFPTDLDGGKKKVRYQWLKASKKLEPVTKLIEFLIGGTRTPERTNRLRQLLDCLQKGEDAPLDLVYFPPSSGVESEYKSFISVPIPYRWQGGRGETRIHEFGVLLIDTKIDLRGVDPPAIFTFERIRMLKVVSAAIDLILTVAKTFNF